MLADKHKNKKTFLEKMEIILIERSFKVSEPCDIFIFLGLEKSSHFI